MANHRALNSVITAGNGAGSELSSIDASWSPCPDQVPMLGSLLQSRLWEFSRRLRLWILAGLTITLSAALWYVPPIPLWSGYHDFADKRTLLLIPNCLDVLSNLPWLLVGVFAIYYFARKASASFDDTYDEIPYFFSSWVLA